MFTARLTPSGSVHHELLSVYVQSRQSGTQLDLLQLSEGHSSGITLPAAKTYE